MYSDEERVCILFYDEKNDLIAISGRSLLSNEKGIKYLTIKKSLGSPKIFGLDRVKLIKDDMDIFVFEGPIDSLFFDNSIATADSDLTNAAKYVEMKRLVLIYDNQPRNKDIVKQMRKAIDVGFRVCIWPSIELCKDVNDMILLGETDASIFHMIKTNTFSGLEAKLRLSKWTLN